MRTSSSKKSIAVLRVILAFSLAIIGGLTPWMHNHPLMPRASLHCLGGKTPSHHPTISRAFATSTIVLGSSGHQCSACHYVKDLSKSVAPTPSVISTPVVSYRTIVYRALLNASTHKHSLHPRAPPAIET